VARRRRARKARLGPCGLVYLCLGLGLFFGRLLPRVLAWFVFPTAVLAWPPLIWFLVEGIARMFSPG
jgi:hypothetical protein